MIRKLLEMLGLIEKIEIKQKPRLKLIKTEKSWFYYKVCIILVDLI